MTPQLKIGRNVPPSKISPGNRTPPCIFYRTSQVPARGFCAQPGRGEYLKPQASPSQDFMPSSGRRNFLKRTASQFLGVSPKPPARIFFDPRRSRRWGRLGPRPQTPAGPSFSERQKRKQKIVQGDSCPLENPPLGSPLAVSPDPTAGILGGNNRRVESQ